MNTSFRSFDVGRKDGRSDYLRSLFCTRDVERTAVHIRTRFVLA